jgi:ubiquinone/menaquinone biosynthesis C-methylase UbiE
VTIDLGRGILFEDYALDYEQYRPGYPRVIVNEIVSLSNLKSSSRVLEVGCGTGKATVQFACRGYMMDCVDPGERLVSFAKRNCQSFKNVAFQIGRFEDVQLEENRYDLVISAHAFHWVEPSVRLCKAVRVLSPNGSLALLYNYPGKRKDRVMETLTDAIGEESRGKLTTWDYLEEVAGWIREIESSSIFRDVKVIRHQWAIMYGAEGYAGLFRTYPDYLSLSKSVQRKIVNRIREIIKRNGGTVRWSYDCVLIHAKRA